MKVLVRKRVVINKDYTFYKRIVKLQDGSNLFQIHISSDKNFRIFNAITFASSKSVKTIFKLI